MSIVQNYIVPILVVIMILTFGGFFFYGIYKFIRGLFPKEFAAWIKYSILKQEVSEKDVNWCLRAFEKNATPNEVEKYLRLHGTEEHRVREAVFIYKQIIKVKGGLKSNGKRNIKEKTFKTFSRQEEKEKS